MSIKELVNLKNEFLNKFLKDCVEQDVIKQIRKVLKEFKEQIYGGDNLQKLLSANVQSSISTNQSTGQSMNSTSSTSKGYNKANTNFQQGANIQNIQSDADAANIQYNTQQRFLLVAACEEIQKLLKYIVQPYIVIKSCIMNFESSQKKDPSELVTIIKQEFASIDKRIVHVVKNYSEVLPINILDTLEDLQKYYIQQKNEYLEKKLEDLEKLKQMRYFQIQAPYIGYHLVDETRVQQLFEKASIQIENLKIQRVGTEFVHHFQKYLTTYVFNKLLMDTDILSGVVVCIKDNKKKKTYFFIQYCDLKVEEIESTSSVDQQIVVTLNKYGQKSPDQPVPTKNVDMNSFFKQIAASFLSLSFESFIPNYGICSDTGKIYRHQLSTTNEDRTAHAGIKNPLYFFKDFFMMEKKSSKDFQQCLNLKQCNMANFLEALTLLHEFQKTDFKFEFKKGRKLQSLYLSKDHINSLQSIVQEFSRTLVWLEESVFPVNGKVCLLQIMNQIQPLVIEFSNRIMSKSMQEHLGFMKKISIEDFLIKISTKKALKKYIQQNKSFEDNRFLKEEQALGGETIRSASQSGQTQTPQNISGGNIGQQGQTGQQQNSNLAGTNLPAQSNSNNTSTFSNYTSSSTQSQGHGANQLQISQSGIQITQYLMELNLLNFHRKERKVILKYAAENLLYLPMILSLEYTQDLIKKFNKSWRSTQLWSDNYQFVFDEIEDDSVLFQIQSKTSSQNKNPPSINQNYNNLFATPIKRKQSNKLSTNYNDINFSSNENICSSNHRLNEIEKNSENYDKSYREGAKQPQQQKQIFESVFVELLGLVFNMNIMSILTSQTFSNLKYFDEYNSYHIYLIKAYFKFPQVRGDKGYKLSETLLERSIKLKKYKLACLLLDQGEGVNITKDIIFNYLSEEKLQPHQYRKALQDNIRQINSGHKCDSPIAQQCEEDICILQESKQYDEDIILKMVQDREEFDQKLQLLVMKHHAQWLNEFNWEKMWRQEFNPENHKKSNDQHIDDNAVIVYTNEYGVRCLPIEIWTQIFDFKRIDSKKFSSENKIEPSKNKIDEEQESGDENTTTAKKKEGKIIDEIPKKSSISINDQNLELQSNFSKEVLRGDSNKQSPRSQGSQTNLSEEGRQSKKQSFKQESEIESQAINTQQEQQQEEEQQNQSQQNQSNEDIEGKRKKSSVDQDQGQNQNEIQDEQLKNENQTGVQEQQEEKIISEQENQNQISRKSSKSDSKSHSGQKLSRDEDGKKENDQKIQEEENNQDKQLSLQIEDQQKNQSSPNNPNNETKDNENQQVHKKSLNLNLDEPEDVGNQTVRLSPLNSQFSLIENLQEGLKLNGILEMKKFSYQDEKNYFISNYLKLLENSQVQLKYRKLVIVHCQNLDFLVEECPQYPGLAYAEDRFIHFFSSHVKPKRMLVRINDVDYTFTQVLHNSISLQNAINQGISYNFDKQSIGESILLNILIGKQHNGLEDEILEPSPNNPKEYRLVNVSESQPFSMQILRFNSVNYAINNRNIIFCLDQMNEPVDSTLIMKYRQINPDKLLDEWLNDLYFFQQKITQQRIIINNPRFIIKSQQYSEELTSQQNIQMNQAILFQKGMIKELYNRLSRLTKYLKKIHYDDHSGSLPKYQEIFEAVSPHLADMYKRVNTQKDVSLPNRFEQILQNLDKVKSFVTCDIPSFYSHFTLEKIYNYESLEEVISTFKSIGPLSSKEIVKQLSKLQRKENLQWDDVFQNVSKNSQIRAIMINGYLENDWNDNAMVEKFISQLTAFQQKPVAEFKHLLSDLIFYSSDIVSWKMIRNLGHDRITTLSLKGCTKITDTDVVKISESMINLIYLDLSKNPNIIKFNHQITSKYNQSKPLQFPQLKTLILEECVNLCICDVEGQHIQNINLNTCIQLQNLMTATPSLKRICLKTCHTLLEEHAILYIIEGTNCMIDEQTSGGAFRQTLSAMTKSTHSKLNTYKIYVLSIFGRLFNKIKILQDLHPLVFALNRRGLNKTAQNKESSSSFFGFSKKTTTTSDSLIKNCRVSAINLLLKNSNIRELKFMNICEEFKDQNVSSILEILCEKFQESAQSTNKNELVTDIDTIDLSDIKLSEKNMKHLGEIISLIKTTSSQGLSIFIQNSQETQSKGMKYFCQGALKNEINKLDMSKNRFGSEQIEEICLMIEGVGAGQKLNQLFLKNCRINNDLLARLSQAIKKNETLRVLDLSDNLFDHEGFKLFMQSLYDNTNLTNLVLDGNSLTGQGFSYIKKGRFLKKLHLEQCWLEEYEISQICELLKEQQQLNYLDLSFNKFNIQSTQNLVSSIKKSNCLKELIIKKIFDEEESIQNATHMSEILINNTSLQTLDISGNSIGNDGLIQFAKALQQNSVLRLLLINDDCNFGLRGIANLAELIQYNNTLQVLEIQGIENNQESKLEGYQAAWEMVKQKLHRNKLLRLSKFSSKKINSLQMPFQKKGNISPTHKSLDQSSFFMGGEKLDSTRIKGTSDHYRLGLSIDGGGMRGIIPGCIIQYLCQNTKREVHEIFDVLGGTSIGGILALALVCTIDGKNPVARGNDLPSFFEDNGSQIFNSSKMVALWNNLRDKSKYDPAGIESILKKYFQNCKLSDVIKGTSVITTAMKRENIQGKNMAKIFRSKEAMFSDDKNFYVRDIARATSAAPTYFPSAEIKSINGVKKYSLIDGALGQNNPSKLVLDDIKTEALNSGNEKNFFLLSLSTGTPITTQQISQNAGIFNLVPIINSLGEGALAFLDRDIEKSADGQYLRINPDIPIKKHEAELDNTDPKIIEIYKQCGYNCAEKFLSQDLKYGPFNDQNLLDWLAENTARKKDTYI